MIKAVNILGCIVLALILYAIPIIFVVSLFLRWHPGVIWLLGLVFIVEFMLLCILLYYEVDG